MFKNSSVTKIALRTGGFDTPFAIASGYSTTEILWNQNNHQ
jgi:hypothetical protein